MVLLMTKVDVFFARSSYNNLFFRTLDRFLSRIIKVLQGVACIAQHYSRASHY